MAATVEKTRRKTWGQAEIARLVSHFHTQADAIRSGVWQGDVPRSKAEVDAKLIELGLMKKPEKETLHESTKEKLTSFCATVGNLAEPQRTLAVRYAIKSLQALLPKRPAT